MILVKSQVTGSWRTRRIVVLGSLAVLAMAWLAAPPAQAQGDTTEERVGAPVRLFPPRDDAKKEDDETEKVILSQPLTGTDKKKEGAGVQVSPLQALDPSSVGLIGPEEGGFGPALWAGSERAEIEALLPRIPVGTVSRAMQRLTRRLLISTAPVPAGQPTVPSLLGLRAERLSAAGDIAAAEELIRLAPPQLADPLIARVEADGLLLSGDNNSACARIESVVAGGSNEPFWIKRLSFCRALNGEIAAARLAADLLRELGETGDDAFFTLIAALSGDSSAFVVSLIDPTPLHLAMLRAARQNIPADSVPGAGPAILRAIASAPNAELDVRLEAAEAAEAVGALTSMALAQIYASVIFSAEETASAVTIAEESPGPRANALLFQVGQIQTVPAARAEALRAAWLVGRRNGGFMTSARISQSALRSVNPEPDLAWFAGDAGLALLAAGETELARRWFDMARDMASEQQPDAAKAVLDLWPLLQIAAQTDPIRFLPEIVSPWWEGQQELPETRRLEKASLIYTLFDAFDYPVPAADWIALLDGPLSTGASIPSAAALRGLRIATRGGRIGETVIYALLILGDTGPAGVSPQTLEEVVRALRAVGLDEDARAIAVEAVLARTL
ncbi:MAG: hypothetical protein IID55_04835 [Proteobacteria bacterium]|nr:hypothetical protein [Pseudomonadota bacterium]